jgi:hypothetical protein
VFRSNSWRIRAGFNPRRVLLFSGRSPKLLGRAKPDRNRWKRRANEPGWRRIAGDRHWRVLTWTAPNIRAKADLFSPTGSFDNCPAAEAAAQFATFPDTTLAAALGSNTLVVTAQDALHVLSLSTGADLQHGPIANVQGPLKNPIIVGHRVYVIDIGASKLVGLTSP